MPRAADSGMPELFADPARRPSLPWTDEQLAVYGAVSKSMARGRAGGRPRHLAVDSVAGSSKTTVLRETLYRLPSDTPTLVLAYNRAVRDVLSATAPPWVRVETLHSYGMKLLGSVWGRLAPSPRRDREVMDEVLPRGLPAQCRGLARRLYALARADMAASPADVLRTLEERSAWLRPRSGDGERPPMLPPGYTSLDLASWVVQAMERSRRSSQTISWEEMCYLPVALGLGHDEYGFVAVDEFQDLSVSQLRLALGAVAPGGMLMGVGDPAQSIYGFRGADPRAMQRFVGETGAEVLAMPTSFRCPEAVAELAREFVPSFRARPGAPAGSVRQCGWGDAFEAMRGRPPGELMVLSRTNAPLVSVCMDFWRAGVPAVFQGRDLARDLRRLVSGAEQRAAGPVEDGAKARPIPVRDLIAWLRGYLVAEGSRLSEEDIEDGVGAQQRDAALSLERLTDGLSDTGEVRRRIGAWVDSDGRAGRSSQHSVLVATVHGAKGLERPTVAVLPTFGGGDDDPLLDAERRNCRYVAYTRASRELLLCADVPGE